MPTITRNAKNTGATGGRSSGATSFRPAISPSMSCVRIRLPSFGTLTS